MFKPEGLPSLRAPAEQELLIIVSLKLTVTTCEATL